MPQSAKMSNRAGDEPVDDTSSGRMTLVNGSVVDMTFSPGHLPPINSAVEIARDTPHSLIVEVQQHVNQTTVRGVAMQETAGLGCGVVVHALGAPIYIPVGDAVLGRLIDAVTGAEAIMKNTRFQGTLSGFPERVRR